MLKTVALDFFNRETDYSGDSFSQEFRIFSTDESSRFGWLLGAIVYDDEAQVNNAIISGDDVILSGAFPGGGPLGSTTPGDRPNENEITVERDGWAAFVDLTFELKDSLTLSIGGRYSQDDDKQTWRNTFASFACERRSVVNGVADPFQAGCSLRPDQDVLIYTGPNGDQFTSGGRFAQTVGNALEEASNDGSNFSPRIALNWDIDDDQSAYGVISTGYRAAGARTAADVVGLDGSIPFDPRSRFDEETVTNYELGWKAYLNDRRTQVEVAAFLMEWDDMQVRLEETLCAPSQQLVASPADCPAGTTGFSPQNVVANADSASSQGIEFSGQTLVSDSFLLAASLGYMDAKFDSFANAPQGDVSGEELPNAPKVTAFVSGRYSWDVEDVSSYVQLEANYKSSSVSRFSDVLAGAFPGQSPSATFVNLRAGANWGNNSLILNITNLFEEEYNSGIDDFSHSGWVTSPSARFANLTWTSSLNF